MWHIFPVLLFGTDNKATLIINYKTVRVHNYKKNIELTSFMRNQCQIGSSDAAGGEDSERDSEYIEENLQRAA